MFTFTPKTEQEIQEEGLLPAGIYPFEVIKAENQMSKKGAPMVKLTLNVYNGESEKIVFDYLLEAMAYKLHAFCKHTGLQDQYDSGALNVDDMVGKSGFVKLKVQKSDEYGSQNSISNYVERPPQNLDEALGGDDIPFNPSF